ncbi:acetate/propionate family kinase [uncultured Abyssibacter sp.]|uniref:acetate/propionate family kinase n=1 Tax=uncultured Abyssibacter sp. TaxID=2320202 RepID=UPI0032B17D5D
MRTLLTLNTGSSSVKFRLFGLAAELPLLAGGKIMDIGGHAVFSAATAGGDAAPVPLAADADHAGAVDAVLAWLEAEGFTVAAMSAAIHRIVHGGERHADPVRLDAAVMDELRGLASLAPLHQAHNLAAVDILGERHPDMPQYGCFDTAFHARHDPLHHLYALPADVRERGVVRYGFHGLSYAWIARRLRDDFPHLAEGRVVAAHLGNGASLCAMRGGRSIDTTMGMTALDGLPMGTRSGAIDPGAVLYMQRELGYSLDAVEDLLYNRSGLKGLSGISNDVKTLFDSNAPDAAFALRYFALRTAQHIGYMAVSIGGMDGLIFTGGIGENAASVRAEILDHLAFLPPFEHHVIAANEERGMALEIVDRYGDLLT